MIDFLLSIVKKLDGRKIETLLENGRRMLSVITIMCCISRVVSNIKLLDHKSMSLFLSMLRLWPDQERKRCIDWEYLDKNIPDEFKKTAHTSVQMFIDELSSDAGCLVWLCAIPVMHFLKGVSKPFQEFEFDPKKVPFGHEHIALGGLGAVKTKTYNKDNFM